MQSQHPPFLFFCCTPDTCTGLWHPFLRSPLVSGQMSVNFIIKTVMKAYFSIFISSNDDFPIWGTMCEHFVLETNRKVHYDVILIFCYSHRNDMNVSPLDATWPFRRTFDPMDWEHSEPFQASGCSKCLWPPSSGFPGTVPVLSQHHGSERSRLVLTCW